MIGCSASMKRDSMTSKTRTHGHVFSHGALFFRLSGRAPRFCVAAGGPFFAVLRVTTVTLLCMATFLVTARFFFVLVDGASRFCGTARGPFLAVLRVTTERLLRVATFGHGALLFCLSGRRAALLWDGGWS